MSPWVPLLSASCSILFTPMVYIEHIFDGSYLTLQVLCWIWNLVQRVKPPDGDFPSSGPPLPPCAPICSSWPSGSLLQAGGPSRTVTLIGAAHWPFHFWRHQISLSLPFHRTLTSWKTPEQRSLHLWPLPSSLPLPQVPSVSASCPSLNAHDCLLAELTQVKALASTIWVHSSLSTIRSHKRTVNGESFAQAQNH